MSKMGQYYLEMQEKMIEDDDYLYQEFHEHDSDYETRYLNTPVRNNGYLDTTKLPVDIKEKLRVAGIDDWVLEDDLPF